MNGLRHADGEPVRLANLKKISSSVLLGDWFRIDYGRRRGTGSEKKHERRALVDAARQTRTGPGPSARSFYDDAVSIFAICRPQRRDQRQLHNLRPQKTPRDQNRAVTTATFGLKRPVGKIGQHGVHGPQLEALHLAIDGPRRKRRRQFNIITEQHLVRHALAPLPSPATPR